ncbi:ABC transporter permease [Solibacillus silvestris]|uniref:ABC transporter permease n=1 Tax=Solibacillus silvestris TaxID=76853 RepID=UPI003F7D21A0
MWGYLKFEFKQFFTNKKNLAIYFLLAFTAIFYAFKVAPSYDPIEKVDYEEMEARYLTRQEFIDGMAGRDLWEVHPVTVDAYFMFADINPLEKARIEALDAGDLQKYAEVTSDWYFAMNYMTHFNEHLSYNERYYVKDREFANADGFFNALDQHVRYEAFEKADYELSLEAFEQRTALQTVERLLKGPLPILLIICALLLVIDIVTKDRLHPSVLKGFPIGDWKKLLAKMFVAFTGSVALFIPLLVGFFIIGFQSGFGHMQLPSPEYSALMNWTEEGSFEMMTLGTFFVRSFALLFVWFIVIINVVLLFSVIIRQEMVNLAVGIFIIFGERFYTSRGVGYFWEVEKIPTTYIQVGKIVSKYQNFYFTSEKLDYRLGLILLAIAGLALLIMTLIISFNKRFKLIK